MLDLPRNFHFSMAEFMAPAWKYVPRLQLLRQMIKKITAVPSGFDFNDDVPGIMSHLARMAVWFFARLDQFGSWKENVLPGLSKRGVCITITGTSPSD